MTESSAKNAFLNNGKFKSNGEVILIKKVETGKNTIYYYSDMTSIKVNKDGKSSQESTEFIYNYELYIKMSINNNSTFISNIVWINSFSKFIYKRR